MNLVKILLTCVLLSVAQIASAQTECSSCQRLLENGLYRTLNIDRGGTFEKDLKTYFASASFKSDFKDHKWGGDLNVLIPTEAGPPIPVGIKANASDQEINTFQQRIASATSIKLNESFYDHLLSSIPDVDLAKEYNTCLLNTCKFGFRTFMDVGENSITFNIGYRKEFEADVMPTIANFAIINGEVLSGALQPGKKLANENTIVVRRVLDKDLIFVLDTDKGAISRRLPAEPIGFNKDLPIGTILTSYLSVEQFNAATSNNINSPGNVWTSRFSKWSPADGRDVPNSKFSLITSQGSVPDLRGMFLRGLNYSEPNLIRTDKYADAEPNRQVGSPQMDQIQGHGHKYEKGDNGETNKNGTFKGINGADEYGGGERIREPVTIGQYGEVRVGTETRSKNIAVYYYIRIN